MQTRALEARPHITLDNPTSRSPLFNVFPNLYDQTHFHCQSFFRKPRAQQSGYDASKPLRFKDGRVYEITGLQLSHGFNADIARRCCIDVIEVHDGEFVAFEIWFYNSVFECGQFQPIYMDQLLHFSRQWVWEFLYRKRDGVPWSRYGHPYVCEVK